LRDEAKQDKKDIKATATPAKAKAEEEAEKPEAPAATPSPGNLHQKESKVKNLAIADAKKPKVDSGKASKMMKSKPKAVVTKA